jgi:hypothetical protein
MQPETRRANLEVLIARKITAGLARDLMDDIELEPALAAIEALLSPSPEQVRRYQTPQVQTRPSNWSKMDPIAKLVTAHANASAKK